MIYYDRSLKIFIKKSGTCFKGNAYKRAGGDYNENLYGTDEGFYTICINAGIQILLDGARITETAR